MIDLHKILAPGKNATVRKVVQKSDTAGNYSNALNELLATPSYVDMVIRAAINAVDRHLPEGYITVGSHIELSHEAPTCLGMTINVKATLARIDGGHLIFDIMAWDELGEVGRGRHIRTVVQREAMLKRVKERKQFLVERSF